MNVIKIFFLKSLFLVPAIFIWATVGSAQTDPPRPDKVLHAEPLYFDLVRDLGARTGEQEFNLGADFIHTLNHHKYALLAEYEFAPIHRLGFEVEIDFSFFKQTGFKTETPNNKLEGLRLSTQHSFFVSPRLRTTMAVGYTQIVSFTDFKNYGRSNFFTGTVYNPFFVAAKCWGNHYHTLIHTSPLIEYDFVRHSVAVHWQINTSFHYILPQTRHFIGVELNQEIHEGRFAITIRPQIKIKLHQNLAIGFVTGGAINKGGEHLSCFLRIIYEP